MNTDINSIKARFETIQLCVFDMAGTTVNEKNLVYKTVRDAINDTLQQVAQTDTQVDLAVCLEFGAGKEKHQAISDILNEVLKNDNIAATDIDQWTDNAFATFKSALAQAYTKDTVATFDGMLALFEQLKQSGKKVVLNTGYDRQTANKIITLLGWSVGGEIDALITADDVDNGRPAPDMITLAMDTFGIEHAQHVLKAGDSGIDIEEGKNAGCGLCVGVLTGAQTQAQLEQYAPDIVLDRLTDLTDLLPQVACL